MSVRPVIAFPRTKSQQRRRPAPGVTLAACTGLGLLVFAQAAIAGPEIVGVSIDQARVIKLPERVATIVIGNPLIADISLQPGELMVITGKGYGRTNILAVDASGAVLLEKLVEVKSAAEDVVIVQRGAAERETYSCSPRCERRITLGDGPTFFNTTLTQTTVRNSQAQAGPPRGR